MDRRFITDLRRKDTTPDLRRRHLARPDASVPPVTSWRHELAIVAPVAVLGQIDVWWISASSAGLQTQTLEAVGVLAFAVALLFRHRAPFAVLVFMGALSCAEALLVERRAFFFGQLVPYVIALAAAAAATRGNRRFSALALGVRRIRSARGARARPARGRQPRDIRRRPSGRVGDRPGAR